MEATAFNATHIDVALIHKWLDKKCQRLVTGPERGIGANMWPERSDQFKAAANIGHNLWQDGRASTREHAQGHIGTWTHDAQKIL